ncbi:MAG: hypothetical protein U9R39_03260 [Campylobacterota bacterium]|nr:hypothetical protein [Campylobacterota bacterium]
MKKLSSISNQIKNNTYSYTGKGSFEAVVNNNKDLIVTWLEELVPLQKQIENLNEKENIDFQKRNYTRILTKIFPEQYKEFVSLNILVRDAHIIGQYYKNEFNVTILYDKLLEDKYLKYPGKYDKYVEFELFQKFLMMYRDELISNNDEIEIEQIVKIEETVTIQKKLETVEKIETTTQEIPETKKETNWTNLLLGKLR